MKIMRVDVRCSRLAWFYVHGTWPDAEIDHINHMRDDDRIDNLRIVTRRSNNQNRSSPRRDSTTGVMGVSRKRNRWQASIQVNGAVLHLGTHDTAESASAAYISAKHRLHDIP